MTYTREIYVVAAARTAIGTFGGALKDVPLTPARDHRGARSAEAQRRRAGDDRPRRDRQRHPDRAARRLPRARRRDRGRAARRRRRRSTSTGCAAPACRRSSRRRRRILLGDAEIAIGGGAESMSRGPYFMNGARWGARMGDMQATDYMLGILHDPFHAIHMGITAENVAARDGITREMQDALALESQQRAAQAIAEGRFKSQIVPVEIKTRKGTVRLRHRRARARRHDDRAAGEDEAGVQARRQRDRGQCVGPQRRRRRARAGQRRCA